MELQRSKCAQVDGAASTSHYGKMMEFVIEPIVFSGRVRADSDFSVSVYSSVVQSYNHVRWSLRQLNVINTH